MSRSLLGFCVLLVAIPLCAQDQLPEHLRHSSHLVRPVSLAGTTVAQRVSASDLSAQYEFLRGMPAAWVDYARSGVTHEIRGELGLSLPNGGADFTVGEPAPEILSLLKPALLARGTEILTVTHNFIIGHNRIIGGDERVIKLEQLIHGIPVKSASVGLSVDSKSGEILSVMANFLPDRGLPPNPGIAASQAIAAVMKELSAGGSKAPASTISPDAPSLAYVLGVSIGEPDRFGRLVWCIELHNDLGREEALVDAVDGRVIVIRPTSRCTVYL